MKSQMQTINDSSLAFISKMSNKVENSVISKANSQLDYTNTRFHNALIVKHDVQQAYQGEVDKMKGAFDMAKE